MKSYDIFSKKINDLENHGHVIPKSNFTSWNHGKTYSTMLPVSNNTKFMLVTCNANDFLLADISNLTSFMCHLILLLVSEYEELQRQISDASSQRIQDDLERELDRLVKRMEAKGEQIKKLSRYQTAVNCCF